MTTKDGTMTAGDKKLCNYLLRRCAGDEEHEAADRIFILSTDNARLTAELAEAKEDLVMMQQNVSHNFKLVGDLRVELAAARGEVERYGNWLRWISKVQGLPEAGISGDILAALAGDAGEP